MLRTPIVLGISMAPRKSRRLFVAVTYAVMLALAVTILNVPSWGDRFARWGAASGAFALVCLLVFGKLVKQTGPLDIRRGNITSLGLAPRRRDENQPDEREVAIRNAACFEAYRVLALYSIAVYAATSLSFDLRASVAVKVLELLTMPLLGMALTLPQAALLWREPDVPEEARV
jgi:hypothetical protein